MSFFFGFLFFPLVKSKISILLSFCCQRIVDSNADGKKKKKLPTPLTMALTMALSTLTTALTTLTMPLSILTTPLTTPLPTLFPRFWLSKNFHFDAFECVQIALRSRSDRFRRVFCVENVGDRCQRSKHVGNVPPSLPGAGAAWRCLLSHMIKKIAKFVSLFLYFVNRVLQKEKK